MTTWTDSHCHLYDERMSGGVQGAVDAAQAAGVTTLITVGCDAATSEQSINHAATFDGVFATVGLHPHEARFGVDSIRHLVGAPGVVAIGECGLDYHYDNSPRDRQRQAFADQIGLAHETGLPLVIHTREAWADTFDILDAETVPASTIFHCFTGGEGEAKQCLDRGAYLSFSGIVSFRSALDVHEAATMCPIDRLLVETDSPYLAPVPHRGRPNQPAFVSVVGGALAALRGVHDDDIASATRKNAMIAFPGIRQ